MQEKKTKIVCTISDMRCEVDFIQSLYNNGMNVARINSAHATLEGAQRVVDNIRQVSDKIAILIDTKGPEVRLTRMDSDEGYALKAGDCLEIATGVDGVCTDKVLYTNCATFVNDVPMGSHILVDDGLIDLLVTSKDGGRLQCTAKNAGIIKGRKSINVPNVHINLPALTEKDKMFVQWAMDNRIDFIAHSFVRSKDDLIEIQKILDANNSAIKIISKIENQQGVDNLKEILMNCFGVMVARGDLGVEIPVERIPIIQNHIINTCRRFRKPVIVATQMLHSMIENPRPTRAEVTDIANAIFERTDAIMLSGETASGKYPISAVATMCKVASETERSIDVTEDLKINFPRNYIVKPIAATLARSMVESTNTLPVKAIIIDTWTGRTARYLAEFRPRVPIYAMCYQERTMRELALLFGVTCYPFTEQSSKDSMVSNAIRTLLEDGRLEKGDLVGFVGGSFNDELGANYMEFRYV